MRLILALLLLLSSVFAYPASHSMHKLGDESSGHTLMVFGGIHGNEPGGFFAPAMLVKHYKITKGALWVIPNLNQKSITKFHRGLDGDMNRKFVHIDKNDPDYETVMLIKSLIKNPTVDLVLNLHDGHGFYRDTYLDTSFNPDAWGQSFVIDQMTLDDHNSTFGSLSDIAKSVSAILNEGLVKDHHYFNVKNTKTRYKNETMQQSLTYFAVKQKKPAFAIETSKNIVTIWEKVLYQLRAIEAFMQIMGIEFTRDFDMTHSEVKRIVREYGTVTINNNIHFELTDIRPILRYMPMKRNNNTIEFSHPLADFIFTGKYYEMYIGHKRITSFFPQYFEMDTSLKAIDMTIDDTNRTVQFTQTARIQKSVTLHAPDGYRVNIIGYTHPKISNENNLNVKLLQMDSRYAIDKDRYKYRAEVYHDGKFCGLIVLDFTPKRE